MCGYKENRGSLPSYAWSPWKEGRSEEEQRELQEIQEIRIPDGIRELGNYTFYGCRNLMTLEMTDSVKTCAGMRPLLYGTGRLEPGFFLSGAAKAVDRGSYGSGDPGSFRQRKSRDGRLSHGRKAEIVCKTKENF